MNVYTRMLHELQSADMLEQFHTLYGNRDGVLQHQLSRYSQCIKAHMDLFGGAGTLYLISAPGRIEIAGNHTDHQNGCVLAAAVNLDMIAAVAPRQDNTIRLQSKGYPMLELSLDALEPFEEERGTTAALIRGVAAGLHQDGRPVGGFDAMVMSDVLSGSGLSSSAAFEVLIAAVFDALYPAETPLDAVRRAQISQFAENVFFGKPSGLMDQMAASLGGLTAIDFKCKTPKLEPLQFSFEQVGYSIVVVNTRGAHDHLTGEYAAIREEMTSVARFFGEDVLRRVHRDQLLANAGDLRNACGDRAVLRALHFFEENERVHRQTANLKDGNLHDFLDGIIESGDCSWMLLQNVHMPGASQPISLALALARTILKGRGAWRVHGGGFAGTTLNFVPQDLLPSFTEAMEKCFGADCCHVLDVRPVGPVLVSKQ